MEILQEVVQDRQENPFQFLQYLTKDALQYSNLDPENPEIRQFLLTNFFSQIFPDIRAKRRLLKKGPLTSQAKVLPLTLKVYLER